MIVDGYEVEVEKAVRELRRLGARRVLIQSPLGLRKIAISLATELSASGFEPLLSNSSCWGACDIAYGEAEKTGVDAIIHIGHTPFLKRDRVPTIYLECRKHDITPLMGMVDKIADAIDGEVRRIGLGSSLQWIGALDVFAEKLRERRELEILTTNPRMFSIHRAQVLGCDYTSLKPLEDRVDAFLIIGSVFHALGMAMLTEKRTYAVDPETQAVKELGEMRKRILMQRYANIVRFREAGRVGVVVSVKPGQERLGLAKILAHLLSKHGKEAFVITADEVGEQLITEYGFDAYINTACPRLSIEDQVRFSKPLLLPAEVLVALGLADWEEIVSEGLLMFPWGWAGEKTKKLWRIMLS